jgi:hypothetical protein
MGCDPTAVSVDMVGEQGKKTVKTDGTIRNVGLCAKIF